ncbi:MAG TPA: hypothetical protein VLA00_00415 [Xanthobacteraceae bacterium]|nr:hypothetical protein [Xanthobacteraceae bacterium]
MPTASFTVRAAARIFLVMIPLSGAAAQSESGTAAAEGAAGADSAPAATRPAEAKPPVAEAKPAMAETRPPARDTAPATAVVRSAAATASAGILYEEHGKPVCIGGTLCASFCAAAAPACEPAPAYMVRLDQPRFIGTLQLYAHDNVGPTRRADLKVKLDGRPVGTAEVYRNGATVSVKIGRTGQLVTVEAAHHANGFLAGGEEAVISDVYLFGAPAR